MRLKPGKYSDDSPSGGYFHTNFASCSNSDENGEYYSPCRVKSVLFHIALLKKYGNNQIPNIAYQSGNLTVPFALGSYVDTLANKKMKNQEN